MFTPTAKGKAKESQKKESGVGGPVAPSPATRPAPALTSTTVEPQQPREGPVLSHATQEAMVELSSIRERRNWLIHQLYTRQEFANCLSVIEAQLKDTEGTCEYALYVKGLLKRMEGNLTESLSLLQAAVLVSPENTETRKQLGRALFLLGRHEEALEAFRESQSLAIAKGHRDWEVELHIGLSLGFLGNLEEAVNAFVRSIALQRIDSTFFHLGLTLVKMKSYDGAIQVYQEALAVSPRNPDLLAAIGQLYMKTGDVQQAFASFGACLAEDPTHLKALVAVSSIHQSRGNNAAALSKYRIAITKAPDSAQLWNNIGVCFFGKQVRNLRLGSASGESASVNDLYTAVACLRKSIILSPLEWITNYNLAIVFLSLGRYVAAMHYLVAAISFNRADFSAAYMYLGVCLSLMNDIDNARQAYEKSLSMEENLTTRVNYAITLLNSNLLPESAAQLQLAQSAWMNLTLEQRETLNPALHSVIEAMQGKLAGVQPGTTPELQQRQPPQEAVGGRDDDHQVESVTAQGLGSEAGVASAAAAATASESVATQRHGPLEGNSAEETVDRGAAEGSAVTGNVLSSVPVFHPPRQPEATAKDVANGGGREAVGESSAGVLRSPSATLASTSLSEYTGVVNSLRRPFGEGSGAYSLNSNTHPSNEDDLVVNSSVKDGLSPEEQEESGRRNAL